ncbi:MAG: sulfurtransferase [Gemmatimonas sp.]|nr:sulfurtransferase [Gemmatimonas sp.]
MTLNTVAAMMFSRRTIALALTAGAVALSACRSAGTSTAAKPVGVSAAPNARAANAAPMLVTTEWAAQHANDRGLVLLHVGTKAQYDSGHVAGSRFVSLEEIAIPIQPGALSLQMASVAQLTAWAARNGLGDSGRVIVIPHDANLQSATRVFFTLAYLGIGDNASLMDGGYQAWKREARAVSTTTPSAAAAVPFTPRVRLELIAQVGQVETATQDQSRHIIDARLTRFFNGDGGGYPRPGHIPSAVNIPISSVSLNGYLRSPAELQALFEAQKVDSSKPVITYCHIGQQATLLWFVATLIGRDARMYDGSFQEWSGSTRPIVGPPAK